MASDMDERFRPTARLAQLLTEAHQRIESLQTEAHRQIESLQVALKRHHRGLGGVACNTCGRLLFPKDGGPPGGCEEVS